MIVSSFIVPAQAKTSVNQVNTRKYQLAELAADVANLEVEVVVKIGQATPYYDVPWVVRVTDRIIFNAKCTIKALGFATECEYVNYCIDGVIVAIDPIRVVTPDGGED